MVRTRKAVSEAQESRATTSKKAEQKSSKRKAADDASPISLKKQKPVKKTPVQTKPEAKPPKADKTKKSAKKAEAEQKEVEAVREDEPSGLEEEQDDGVLLLADELDSSDEQVTDKTPFKPGQDVGKVPAVSTDVLDAAKPFTGERGVLYIGRIPHGFYEHEMRQYLSQFGPVTRLRISRNKKTGASKHFAFVEFEEESTAEIVVKTMDNYLLFGHVLKVKMVPKGQVHEELFKGSNRRFKKVPWNKMAGRKLAKPRTKSAWETKVEKERANRAKKVAKMQALGYEFEAPELKDVPAPEPREKEIRAIEAAPLVGNGDGNGVEMDEAAPRERDAKEPEQDPEVKISAPKTKDKKGKATKSGKAKEAKA